MGCFVSGKECAAVFGLGKPDRITHKKNVVLKGFSGRTPHTDNRTALVGYLHLVKPLAEGAPGSKVVKTFLPFDVEPVLIFAVYTGKHTKVDDPQSSLIITVSHTDHFRAVKVDAGDVVAHRSRSGEERALPVHTEFSGKE